MILGCEVAAAQTPRPKSEARGGDGNSSVIITNPGEFSPGEPGPSTKRVRLGGTRRPLPRYVVPRSYLATGNDGEACVATERRRRDSPITSGEQGGNAFVGGAGGGGSLAACAQPDGSIEAAQPSPAQVAEAFLREVPLPLPEPRIAPDGQAITGLAAFLETNGTLTHAMGDATPLGPVAVEASGAYFVDWGDGSPEAGPFDFEGEPYPSGRIFHHYDHTGSYTVTLRTSWNATWNLGGDSGTVEGLSTQTTLPVEVFEVQAVIRR